ncbi:MAG TPA: hypothetical protein PLI01_00345 [Nitrospira sp.]|nr:hypothetical protein [Nitrospira sp.]HNA25208.1 hypothetical protein [Nitrospira sp.]HNI17498.1 hypothetical protein [Nitrospira sp.]
MYDPQVSGYNPQYWKTVVGASDPSVTADGIVLTNTTIETYISHRYAGLLLNLKLPVDPQAAQNSFWGFGSVSLGNRGKTGFIIENQVFKAVAYDNVGTLIKSTTITWDASWTNNTTTVFEVVWRETGVRWLINGVKVAEVSTLLDGFSAMPTNLGLPIMLAADANTVNMFLMDIRDLQART